MMRSPIFHVQQFGEGSIGPSHPPEPDMILGRHHYWAKLRLPAWHPLRSHLADVGAVMSSLLVPKSALSKRLAGALGLSAELLEPYRRVAIYLALLHDIGKLQHGFQERRDSGASRFPRWRGHVRTLLDSWTWVPSLKTQVREIGARVGGTDIFWGAICHHGRPHDHRVVSPHEAQRIWATNDGRDPLTEWISIEAQARRWSGLDEVSGTPLQWTAEATHLLAGIITLADWLGSSETYFPLYPQSVDHPEEYWLDACSRAEQACQDVGLITSPMTIQPGLRVLEQAFPHVFPKHLPTTLQSHLATMPLPVPGSRLLIESDTGSGKTEAALALFARLRASGQVSGLFFALPTRATATAIHGRIVEVCRNLYPHAPPSIALAVGGQSASNQRWNPKPTPQDQNDPDLSEPTLVSHWTSQSNRHALAAEIVVGTIDQALLAALPARHAHLRLAGISRLLLVVDEVHSFDRYMTVVLQRLCDVMVRSGTSVVFVSATLSNGVREQLGLPSDSWPSHESLGASPSDAANRPYPSLSIREPNCDRWTEVGLQSGSARDRFVRWRMSPLDGAMEAAATAAKLGARVLIVRNTVADTWETIAQLTQRGAEDLIWRPRGAAKPTPYHSRYTRADRQLLDLEVLEDFGPGSTRSGVILVATAVIGQSLDVDLDLLISDLCPVDVLLQRIGRIHRHMRRERYGQDVPTALVIEPETPLHDLVGSQTMRSTHGLGTVFPDLGDLELTRRLIATQPEISLPAHARILIEEVYHPSVRDLLASESDAWQAHLIAQDGLNLGQESHGKQVSIDFQIHYMEPENVRRFGALEAAGGREEARVRTRLGDDKIRLPLPYPVPNHFADDSQQDQFVDINARLALQGDIRLTDDGPIAVEGWERGPDGVSFRAGTVQFAYRSDGWRWIR